MKEARKIEEKITAFNLNHICSAKRSAFSLKIFMGMSKSWTAKISNFLVFL